MSLTDWTGIVVLPPDWTGIVVRPPDWTGIVVLPSDWTGIVVLSPDWTGIVVLPTDWTGIVVLTPDWFLGGGTYVPDLFQNDHFKIQCCMFLPCQMICMLDTANVHFKFHVFVHCFISMSYY